MDHSILINNLRNGKEEGLTAVYRLYKRSLLYFASQFVDRETAEEIVSDTFIKVWKQREQFHHLNSLRAFLYVSAKNACLNHLRRPQIKLTVESVDDYENLLYEDAVIHTKIVETELLKLIYEEAAKLPQKQREVFNMTYLEGMTVEEISKKLQMSPTAVYINRSRAMALLRRSTKIKDILYFLIILQHL